LLCSKQLYKSAFVLFFGSVAFYPATAEEMSSGNYMIQSDSINIAGVLSTTSNYRLDDVVKLARKIGFHLVSIYTNGTFPINFSTDSGGAHL